MTQISTSVDGQEMLQEIVRLIVEKYQRQQKEQLQKQKQKEEEGCKPLKRPYDPWHARLQDLVQFQIEHRHCLVPYRYPKNQALACWVKKQRYAYKQYLKQQQEILTSGTSSISTSMEEKRIKILDELGFVWDSHQAKWEQMFRELLGYRKNHGDCDVPAKYPPNKPLGLWVTRQRITRREAGTNMSHTVAKRIVMLESIGFMW
eukprot:CAMPEP_0194250754 /NCGR_PEP_ID=MMETSP0158-20130606/23846_1 /TAXON_ID=33649 /ORGANISM="Thalassionema nitzschioides, Strain L26-B" /LENGTH=203 /DNA_ID=CAMNT_0038987669 /DNA_START=71 /DNA_END=679 /DNA_ORIENTATION=+